MLLDILGVLLYGIMLIAFLVLPTIIGRIAENLLYALKNMFLNWLERSRRSR